MSLFLLIGFACLAAAAFLVGEVATLPAREREGTDGKPPREPEQAP